MYAMICYADNVIVFGALKEPDFVLKTASLIRCDALSEQHFQGKLRARFVFNEINAACTTLA
ncbi:hypothetical protein WK02_24630 [Burkholderia cepacia]|nr:hypothetical protein WJ46_01015 [Burkholderia cepacia]KVQ27832.1 hypothetical protein WK02_24630 [Burkholderia cepacia]